MQPQDQLEIIGPGGEVEFYLLDPARGVTNIGRHPDNDVVLDSPSVDLFQAVLDHQERPYRIMILSEQAEARLDGQLLVPNVSRELHAWDTVEMDGYAIVLLEGAKPAEQKETAPAAAPLPAVSPTREAATAPAGFVPVLVRPPDQVDEIIIAELSERTWTLDVEQTASFELTVTNGGGFVATFEIRVEGVEGSWVTVSPDSLNLNEGARGTVAIHITPPRLPSSSAGPHHLVVVVTSSNYPNRVSRLGATLTINPYYEFSVGDLSPKQQTVSWRQQSGHASLPIGNRGNSVACFRLDGDDDERGCRFEFDLPGEEVQLARQAEMRLAPEETWVLPVSITPIRRRLIGLRARSYSYTITTALVEAAQTPRSVMGQIKSRPLIGPLLLLLIAFGTLSLFVFLSQPGPPLLERVHSAQGEGGNGAEVDTGLPAILAARDAEALAVMWWGSGNAHVLQAQGDPRITIPGELVTLRYSGARFHRFTDPDKSEWDPERDRKFFLNRLNSFFLELRLEFSSDGEDWRTVSSPADFEDDIAGTIEVVAAEDGSYRLRADTWISKLFSGFTKTSDKIDVPVTPVEPEIVSFWADSKEALMGSVVTIYWEVKGADELELERDGVRVPLLDDELVSDSHTFTLDRTTTFALTARNDDTEEPARSDPDVTINVIVPTPVIERFDVEPQTITTGETVWVSWWVIGADTVEIDPLGADLPLQGERAEQPTELETYTLTARRIVGEEEGKASRELQVFVNPPTSTPTPTPTATPTPVPEAPDVQVFDAVPKTIVEGDDTAVTLTWSVTGTTTDIQITGAGIPFTGLDRQGSLSITISEGTIFVLTAYNGQVSSSKHVQIGTIEATPVPPEAPFIDDFSADIDREEIVYIDYETGVYMILEGADVTLKWVVQGEEYELELNGTQVSGDGRWLGPIDEDKDYQLKAYNEGGYHSRDLYIRIAARELPPPIEFGYDSNTGIFSWKYLRPDAIEGFRLYRTPGKRELVAATDSLLPPESKLPRLPDPVPGDAGYVYSWALEPCEEGTYFLVAVYKDPYNNNTLTETDAAEDSWGVTCPTPTPAG